MAEIEDWNEFIKDLMNAVNRVAFYCKKTEMIKGLTISEILRLRDELDKKLRKQNEELSDYINGEIEK